MFDYRDEIFLSDVLDKPCFFSSHIEERFLVDEELSDAEHGPLGLEFTVFDDIVGYFDDFPL